MGRFNVIAHPHNEINFGGPFLGEDCTGLLIHADTFNAFDQPFVVGITSRDDDIIVSHQ